MDEFRPLWARPATPFTADRVPSTTGFRAGLAAIGARVIKANAPAQPESDANDERDFEAPQQLQQVDVEAEVQAAHAEGYAAGRAEALAELGPTLEELRAQLDQVGPLVDEVQRLRGEALRVASEQVGGLVVGLCERVLGAHLTVDAEAITALVRQSVARFPPEDELVIRVPPAAVKAVQDMLPERKVIGDATIEAGCRVEARYASLEATLATVLEGVERAVQGWLDAQP